MENTNSTVSYYSETTAPSSVNIPEPDSALTTAEIVPLDDVVINISSDSVDLVLGSERTPASAVNSLASRGSALESKKTPTFAVNSLTQGSEDTLVVNSPCPSGGSDNKTNLAISEIDNDNNSGCGRACGMCMRVALTWIGKIFWKEVIRAGFITLIGYVF